MLARHDDLVRSINRSDAAPADWFYKMEWQEKPLPTSLGSGEESLDLLRDRLHQKAGLLAAQFGLRDYDSLKVQLDQLCAGYIHAAFGKLGWHLQPDRFTTVSLTTQLRIVPRYHRLVTRMLDILSEHRIVERDGPEWVLVQNINRPT